MAARRMTRSLREHQSAYEDRARAFQERMNTCREAYRDAKDALDGLRLVATDNPQRKSQLADRLYANILQLRAHSYAYDTVMAEWTELIRTYNLQHEDSDWAASMRRQHDDYFAQLPALDERITDLLAVYQERYDRAEDQLATPQRQAQQSADEAHPEGSNNASSVTTTSNGANGETDARSSRLAHTADGTALQRDSSGVSRMAHPAVENDLLGTPDNHVPNAGDDTSAAVTSTPRQRPIIREAPPEIDDEVRELSMRSEGEIDTDTEFHDAPTESHVRRTTARQEAEHERREVPIPQRLQPRDNASPRRDQPTFGRPRQHGVFAQGHGLFTDASPMAWQPKRPGSVRPQDSLFYSEAPPSPWTRHAWIREQAADRPKTPLSMASAYAAPTAPGSHAAHTAAGYREVGKQSRQASRPPSPPQGRTASYVSYKEHRDRLRQGLGHAPPAGGGHSRAPPPAPTPPPRPASTAGTKQPHVSAANVHSQPPPKVDHGVDFGRENASLFHRNGPPLRTTTAKQPQLVLREMPIPKFGGDLRAYPMFRNRFIKTVGARDDLEPSEKFQYLLQSLEGEPFQMANGYLITEDNYYKILDRLEKRYNNPMKLATLLAQDFIKLKPVAQTSRDLQRFHDEALRLVDLMEQVGQDIEGNLIWRQNLLSKIPMPLMTELFKNSGKSPMTTPIREILNLLSDRAEFFQECEAYANWNSSDGNSVRPGPPRRTDPRSTPQRAGTYATDADATHAAHATKRDRRCAYCGRDHWSLKCDIYTTIAQRLRRLQQLRFCFLCLRGGHWSGTCPKRRREACSYCNDGQHHQSLCRRAVLGKRQPFSSLRNSPVRATTSSGGRGILKNHRCDGGSSSQQAAQDRTPVTWAGSKGEPPATTTCPPSAQGSSKRGKSNSKNNRRDKSKDSRTDPKGQQGTTRPTTAFVDENVTQMDAHACGSDGNLSGHPSHLTTDRRSTPAEAPWYDRANGTNGSGFGEENAIPDVDWERVPSDEEASLPDSTGHCSDAETEPPAEVQYADDPSWFAQNPDYQDYSGYAVSTASPADNKAVLLECLKTTAVNINNGISRSAIVFFDSGSNVSYIAMKLALELQLPCLEKRRLRVHTFGTDKITMIDGFDTTILLRSPQGAQVSLVATASESIVPPVTTALLKPDEVAMLRRNECSLISTRETPDLLIGQDLVHLFGRKLGSELPNGFYVVWSILGPMVGGAGQVAYHRTAADSTTVAAAPDAEPQDTATETLDDAAPDTGDAPSSSHSPAEKPPSAKNLGYNPDDPLNLWTLEEDDPAPSLAHTADSEAGATTQSLAHTADSGSGMQAVTDASTLLCSLIEKNDADLFGDFSHVENAGIGTSEMTPDDQAAADMLKNMHKRHPDGRYEVPLLFRTPDGEPPSNDELPTNIALAKGRSFSTRKMLAPHAKKMLDYHSVIMDWKERGFIKEAPKNTQHTKHALSHHPVFKETSTTTATRPVYDASAKLPGRASLNDWLFRGPVLLPEVVATLLRSRPSEIVVLADISKAFLQMEVKASHKDCLRFYWFRDPFKEPTEDNLIEYRFERVPFGLKSAPFLLAGVIKLHLERVGTPLALEMLQNCYVDNVLLTADTVSEALAKYREAKKIFAQIGMPLREFASNSAEFNDAIDPADKADLTKLKELGIRWDVLSDYWDIPLMPKQAPPTNTANGPPCTAVSSATRDDVAHTAASREPDPGTQKKRKSRKKTDDGRLSKRTMLRLVARIFDPQGLVQAATLLAKLVIQEAWRTEKDWDDEITGDLAQLWHEAIKNFDTTVIRVHRRIAKSKIKSVEIHIFTDGSSYAYGFTAYLRVRNSDGTYSTNLVFARARVKPIKDAEKFTIPRMELLGVLLGARIAAFLSKELPIPVTATYLWSDSTIVLHQVANNEALKEVWTQNRLKEIRILRDKLKIQFRHVPTDDNPADIVSRGIAAAELQQCEKWWHGPPFLAFDSTRWPEQPSSLRTRPSSSDQPTELYGTTAFTTLFLELPSQQRQKQWIRHRSQRKKPNPLDTITEPLPPTSTIALAAATVADAAHPAARPPKLPSDPILPREMEEKYDRWPRLVRMQYYVVRFTAACLRTLCRNLTSRNLKRRHAPALGFDLDQCFTTLGRKPTLRDLQLVTMIILRKTQLRHPPSNNDRRDLGIFESQGLLYVKGRLGNMKLRPTALTPLFLPREAREAELIILEYHRINGHSGTANTLANLRMRYWFTRGRITVQKVLRKYCFECRRETIQPFVVPPWPQLPTSRVTNARPFFFTGLDFFGPLYLRAQNGSGGYYVSKYYVCIFVCMTLRCIHLELCDDLSTDAFLHAFKRFGFRREFPHRILSDNGLSFITAREVIQRISGRGGPAHQQPVKRTLPVRKVVSARLAARRMPAPADLHSAIGAQRQRLAHTADAALPPLSNHAPPLTQDEEKLVDFCQRHNIEWQTITELSPWKGGVYERLIGLVKHCLRRSIGNTKPTVVEFLSLLHCAEHTANCRPLSYVADSDTDFILVRPQDFLIPMLNQEAHQYPLDPAKDDFSPDDPDFIGPGENKLHAKLLKDLSKGRHLADAFWQNFRDGVLLDLRNRGIDSRRRQLGEATIQPGDLVLVSEKDVPRSDWRLALVLELLPHSDGLCRSARIRYAKTKRETNRALEHLYPIGKIPPSTAACSTVSRLGIYLTVLLSDIVTMSDTSSSSTTSENAASNIISNSSVPISSATFDATGRFALAHHTPQAVATAASQPTGLAHPADQSVSVLVATDASGLAHTAGQNAPEPATTDNSGHQRTAGLPSCSGPLFDPVQLQLEHVRQIGVAMNERMRITDAVLAKFQRCLNLEAAGRPADRNYADLHAEMTKYLSKPPSSLAAPRADPLADQGTQTDPAIAAAPRADRGIQTDVTVTAFHEINAFFWAKIAVTGQHVQDDNQFLKAPMLTASEPPSPRRSPAPPAIPLGARASASATQAGQRTAGSDMAHTAVPMPVAAPVPDAAHTAATGPAPRAQPDRPPFNSAALLRAQPVFNLWPDFPALEEIERRVRQFFAIVPEGQTQPVLEPIDESTLYSTPTEPTQKLSFVVNRSSLCPIPSTWDPLVFCDGEGEQDCFHCSIRKLRVLQAIRWITGADKKDAQLRADLHTLLERRVPSFGHMILLSYAVRLRSKGSDIRALVEFMNKMLVCRDFVEDIPKLLATYQPRMVMPSTPAPWPTDKDLRVAAKRWTCYCQKAYTCIFERLSGPIIWSPEWMLSKDLPSAARQAFDKMATNAATQLDIVRHMVYRHFGLKHVLSTMHDFEYEWTPLDAFSDDELLAEGDLLAHNKTLIFVDEYTFHYFGATLKEKIWMVLIPSRSSTAVIDAVLDKYPSREVQRIVFWFGTEYIVDSGNEDYGALVAFLSHHFAEYFGSIEQFVIAPPYAQTHDRTWTFNVLGLLVQKDVMLPHARLIIDPHDLQLWRHQHYPTTTAVAANVWPSRHLKQNGRLRTPHAVEIRKHHLRKYHGLDLWTYYEVDYPTAPMPAAILQRTIDGQFTEPGMVQVLAHTAEPETSSAPDSADAAVSDTAAEALPPLSVTPAKQKLRVQDAEAATDAGPRPELSATPDAATSLRHDAPTIAAPTANLAAPATIADIEARTAPIAAGLAELKGLLLKLVTPTPAPSAKDRSPDTDPERDA